MHTHATQLGEQVLEKLRNGGERTSSQALFDPTNPMSALLAGVVFASSAPYITDFPGTYANYRKMSSNPTLAMAKAIKISPILAAGESWNVKPELGTRGDVVLKFVREMLEPMLPQIINDMSFALDMGNQSFEIVPDYERQVDPVLPSMAWVIRKMKALLQDITRVQVDRHHGNFEGLENNGVDLEIRDCFHYVYDMRAGNWYGRSLHENLRTEFADFDLDTKEAQKLTKKVSGIIPIAKVLRGMAKDANGQPIDRFEQMKTVVGNLAQAKGVIFESLALNADDVRNNPDLLKATDVDLTTIDVGNQGSSLSALLERRRQYQSEFMMGWLLPPRTALEGTHGTLAEAEAHANIGIVHSELIHKNMTTMLNWHVIDKVLEMNFGPEMRGAVWVEPAPIVDYKKDILKQILTAILANPATFEMFLMETDQDQVMDRLDIPKRQQVAGAGDGTETPISLVPAVPNPAQPTGRPVPPSAAESISRTFANQFGTTPIQGA